tara:strand:+ start:1830 stop:2009 length:180 start_codon:yes stop_codon:yes gene_type:complete
MPVFFKTNHCCPIKNSSFKENLCEHRVLKAYKKEGLAFCHTGKKISGYLRFRNFGKAGK